MQLWKQGVSSLVLKYVMVVGITLTLAPREVAQVSIIFSIQPFIVPHRL